jgi:LmbE family N-acetylglucosaminyl deacetylase
MLGFREIVIGSRESALYEGDGKDRQLIMEQLEAIQPDIVFIMWPQDSHPEHRRVAQNAYDAILNSFWDQKLSSVREIYAFETDCNQSMQYFLPDLYIRIQDVEEDLKAALKICIAGKG